jgi:hypothetical protein
MSRSGRTNATVIFLVSTVAAGALFWPRSPVVAIVLERVTSYPGSCTRVGHFRVTNHSSHPLVYSLALEFKQGQLWLPQPLGGGTTVILESDPKCLSPQSSSVDAGLLPHACLWRATVRYRRDPETWLHRVALRGREVLERRSWWRAAGLVPVDHRLVQQFKDPVHQNGCPTNGCTEPGDSALVPGRTSVAPGR